MSNPEVLILDEPMSGLDPDGRILIKDILKSLKLKNLTEKLSQLLTQSNTFNKETGTAGLFILTVKNS